METSERRNALATSAWSEQVTPRKIGGLQEAEICERHALTLMTLMVSSVYEPQNSQG